VLVPGTGECWTRSAEPETARFWAGCNPLSKPLPRASELSDRALEPNSAPGPLEVPPKLDPVLSRARVAGRSQNTAFSRAFLRSGRQDLNLRPPGPQPERSRRTGCDSALSGGLSCSDLCSVALSLDPGWTPPPTARSRVFPGKQTRRPRGDDARGLRLDQGRVASAAVALPTGAITGSRCGVYPPSRAANWTEEGVDRSCRSTP